MAAMHTRLLVTAGASSPPPLEQRTVRRPPLEAETLKHFQALIQADTSSPPGNEIRAVEYLKKVLDAEGIPYQVFAKDPQRPNLVVRMKGNGSKRPVLVLGHTDVVTVDAKKWTFPPFGATLDGGYVYGRGTVDDKDNLVAGLMLVLQLHRNKTPLERDVILLAESGEEGAPEFGAQFMIDQHFEAIDAEFCLAEGGGVVRAGGKVKQANVGTTEKEPRPIELIVTARPATARCQPEQRRAGGVGGGRPHRRLEAAAAAQRDHRLVLQTAGDHVVARAGAALPRPAQS